VFVKIVQISIFFIIAPVALRLPQRHDAMPAPIHFALNFGRCPSELGFHLRPGASGRVYIWYQKTRPNNSLNIWRSLIFHTKNEAWWVDLTPTHHKRNLRSRYPPPRNKKSFGGQILGFLFFFFSFLFDFSPFFFFCSFFLFFLLFLFFSLFCFFFFISSVFLVSWWPRYWVSYFSRLFSLHKPFIFFLFSWISSWENGVSSACEILLSYCGVSYCGGVGGVGHFFPERLRSGWAGKFFKFEKWGAIKNSELGYF